MTEIEKKAEEYAKKPSKLLLESLCCGSDLPENDYTLGEVAEPIKQAYKDGYEQGQKETMSYKDNYIKDLDGIIDTFKKENEELMNAVTEKNSVVEKMKNCGNCSKILVCECRNTDEFRSVCDNWE